MANQQAEMIHEFRRQIGPQQNVEDEQYQNKCGYFCYRQRDNYRNLKYFKDNYRKISMIQTNPLLNIYQQNEQRYQTQQTFEPIYDQFDHKNLFQKSSVQLFNTQQVNFNQSEQNFNPQRPITAQNLHQRINIQKRLQSKTQKQKQISESILPELQNIQTICKVSNQDYQAEKKDNNNKFNMYQKRMDRILEDQGELGQAVSQYIELERAQVENMKDKILRRELKKKQQQASNDNKIEYEDAIDDNKLLSIKEIYIDMKRNEELDHVNFLSKEVIQQCKGQKEEYEKFMSKKFKKPKIWKLKYEGVIGPISYDACNFY